MRSSVTTNPLAFILLFLISVYRKLISPVLPNACRFYPSCSQYAAEAIHEHGVGQGFVMAVKRVCRCHPLNAGGEDPVPIQSRKVDTANVDGT